MKQEALKKLIKEAVREAIQEELKEILVEAVKAPKQTVVETIQPPQPTPHRNNPILTTPANTPSIGIAAQQNLHCQPSTQASQHVRRI